MHRLRARDHHLHAPAGRQARFQGTRWTETRGILESVTYAMAALRYEDLREFGPGRDVLEVGCGTGEFLLAASNAGHRVSGLDLSEEAVAYTMGRHPGLDIRCETLDSCNLRPESFDVVAAFHVLEHVGDPVGLLHQMVRLLRPGGLVYIRVPNLDTWYRRVLGRNWWGFSVEHTAHFTDASIRLALKAAGLQVATVRSGDSDRQHSMWPILPLLLWRGVILRSLGDALAPGEQGARAGAARLSEQDRMAMKSHLIATYLAYRRSATKALAPLSRAQLRHGGGPELVGVARKP
jgi:2-polyprenyl-3-methyl-5-hydroxy-6-metoxy-1,4-benzoquinol methylase